MGRLVGTVCSARKSLPKARGLGTIRYGTCRAGGQAGGIVTTAPETYQRRGARQTPLLTNASNFRLVQETVWI